MTDRHRYLHLDVFTDRRFSGNQLAVLPDARGLSGERMQTITAEIGFSETAFVLPSDQPGCAYRLRIFTPRTELPFAGHPTIGTTFALAHDGLIEPGTERVVLELGVGPTELSLEWHGAKLAFAWMEQPIAELGPECTLSTRLARGLGVDLEALGHDELPVEVASSGVPVLFVPIRNRSAVDRVTVNEAQLRNYFRDCGLAEMPVFVYALESDGDDATVHSRMFAPVLGIAEDPATGGASGPLGCLLAAHGAVTEQQATHLVSRQGVHMGRPSTIRISVSMADGQIAGVRVGGTSVLVAEGVVNTAV